VHARQLRSERVASISLNEIREEIEHLHRASAGNQKERRYIECVTRLLCALLLGSVLAPAAGQPARAALQISHHARAMTPGEIVLVDIRSTAPIKDVRADWLKQTLVFYEITPQHWQGLTPLDLGAKAGLQPLMVHALSGEGRSIVEPYTLKIAPKVFPSRRITVDPKFAEPPAEELPRIEKERQTVEAILAKTTLERYWRAPFVVPVPGAATSSFGRRSIVNGQPGSQHSGTDFQAAAGTPVVAPNRGRVVLAADHYFPGRTIIIDHGLGLYSYLAHLSEFRVKEGDIVERGQTIALSGSTGRVTGPHLHWTLRLGAARIDPLSLLTVLGE
jgi:murein DD-endopeptidase MepM/ murein hydrolase activator NlpD